MKEGVHPGGPSALPAGSPKSETEASRFAGVVARARQMVINAMLSPASGPVSWNDTNRAAMKEQAGYLADHIVAEVLRYRPVPAHFAALFSRANMAAGHPADDEDQSNDAILGRMFIAQRRELQLALSARHKEEIP